MVLQGGDDDLIPRLEEFPAVGLGHEVDPFGGPPDKDDVFAGGGSDKTLYLLPRLLVGVGGPGCQGVSPPVDVGVVVLVEAGDSIDDALGLLSGSAVIQPGQILAMNLLVQSREILPDGRDIQGAGAGGRGDLFSFLLGEELL